MKRIFLPKKKKLTATALTHRKKSSSASNQTIAQNKCHRRNEFECVECEFCENSKFFRLMKSAEAKPSTPLPAISETGTETFIRFAFRSCQALQLETFVSATPYCFFPRPFFLHLLTISLRTHCCRTLVHDATLKHIQHCSPLSHTHTRSFEFVRCRRFSSGFRRHMKTHFIWHL